MDAKVLRVKSQLFQLLILAGKNEKTYAPRGVSSSVAQQFCGTLENISRLWGESLKARLQTVLLFYSAGVARSVRNVDSPFPSKFSGLIE